MSWLGASVRRLEDGRLLRGRGRFAANLPPVRPLHVRVVRSPLAHARLHEVRTTEARRLPGVAAVVSADDLTRDTGAVPRIPVRLPLGYRLDPWLQPVLATGALRYVGEPVAVVVAEDPYLAEDAGELVEIVAEAEPAVLEGATALADGAPLLHGAGNRSAVLEYGWGDVEAAFARAAVVVEAEVRIGRHSGVPLEPRTLSVAYDRAGDRLDIWGVTKVPVFNRRVLAGMLAMPEHRIRMHAVDAGGGFGPRGEFYPEDFLVPWLARSLRTNLVWTEDRAADLLALNHSREQVHRIGVALDREGRLLGLRDEVVHDNGAYIRTHGVIVPELTLSMLPGPYRLPAYSGRAHVAHTNKTPAGTYRAPGRFEGTFAREHVLDVAADAAGIDRLELRRRNLIEPGEMPYRRPIDTLGTELVLDTGDYPGLLEAAREHLAGHGWTEQLDGLRAQGRRVGLGVACFVEKSGLGPYEVAEVMVDTTGAVRVHSGGTSLGQGVETVVAQIAGDVLGIDPHLVDVVSGDTELAPFGLGSWASRFTVVGGTAVLRAAEAVRDRALAVASELLEVGPADLRCRGGGVEVEGTAGFRVSLGEIAAACAPGGPGADGGAPGLSGRGVFEVEHMTYPYGVHAALVELDEGTGGVRVLRYLVAYEVGRAVNPALVEGQLVGGVAQGLGGALLEEFRYDPAGQPRSASFMDYLMPTAAEVPTVELVVTEDAPSPGNPLGAKGAGEGGITAVGGAVANAVRDALGGGPALPGLPVRPELVLCRLAGRPDPEGSS